MENFEKYNLYSQAKRKLRILIASFLYYTGVLNFLMKIKLRNKAAILMYHRVLDKEDISSSYSQNGIIVSKKTFANQMKFLQKHFVMISLSDVIKKITNKIPFVSKSCLVTFDDGWKDNFQNAYPVLKSTSVPAVIFLPTDFVETDKTFWQEKLTQLFTLLYQRCKKNEDLKLNTLNLLNIDDLSSILNSDEECVKEKILSFVASQKEKRESHIEDLIYRLETHIEPLQHNNDSTQDFLKWDEIKIMAKNGVDFGSHGKSHRILTNNGVDIQWELKESKNIIEDKLNLKIDSFSYPNGNHSEEVATLVKRNGYEIAFGTGHGFVSYDDDPYTLKRINIHEDMTNNKPMFLARIVGLW